MNEVSVTEFRNHLPAYLKRVERGEEVVVTSRGKAVAKLVPPVDPREAARNRLRELQTACRVGDVVSPTGESWAAEDDPA